MPEEIFVIIGNNWINYIFGSQLIAGVIILGFFMLWGVRQGWSLEGYIVVLTPLIAITSAFLLPDYMFALTLFALGFLIGFGLLKIINR